MAETFWDSFDHLLHQAEQEFLDGNFDAAFTLWSEYYRITAKKEYKRIVEELQTIWDRKEYTENLSLIRLFQLLQKLRGHYKDKQITSYTYQLLRKYLVHIYQQQFRVADRPGQSMEAGVFEYLSGNYAAAVDILSSVLQQKIDALPARIYLGYAWLALKEQRPAIALLSQNFVLSADELWEDDLYLSQFKMLYGRLYSEHGNAKEAAWLLAFESWYRNWLIFEEDKRFFNLIQTKEMGERIIQVKYYAYERIRHFVRCLFITEYARLHSHRSKNLIQEQEKYMARLDVQLFERYLKKRKKPKSMDKEKVNA